MKKLTLTIIFAIIFCVQANAEMIVVPSIEWMTCKSDIKFQLLIVKEP